MRLAIGFLVNWFVQFIWTSRFYRNRFLLHHSLFFFFFFSLSIGPSNVCFSFLLSRASGYIDHHQLEFLLVLIVSECILYLASRLVFLISLVNCKMKIEPHWKVVKKWFVSQSGISAPCLWPIVLEVSADHGPAHRCLQASTGPRLKSHRTVQPDVVGLFYSIESASFQLTTR